MKKFLSIIVCLALIGCQKDTLSKDDIVNKLSLLTQEEGYTMTQIDTSKKEFYLAPYNYSFEDKTLEKSYSYVDNIQIYSVEENYIECDEEKVLEKQEIIEKSLDDVDKEINEFGNVLWGYVSFDDDLNIIEIILYGSTTVQLDKDEFNQRVEQINK